MSPSNLATGCFKGISRRTIHLNTALLLVDVQEFMHTRSSLYAMECSHAHSCTLYLGNMLENATCDFVPEGELVARSLAIRRDIHEIVAWIAKLNL